MREVNLLPVASTFGHTYDKKLLFPVYYTPADAKHVEPGDLQPIDLPTIRRRQAPNPLAQAQAGQMKAKFALGALQLLLLGLILAPAVGAAVPELPPGSRTQSTQQGWRWPLEGEPAVVLDFDKPAERWLSGHRGVDLAAAPAVAVVAPRGGRVSFAATIVDRPVLVIDHGHGFKTSLEPVSAAVAVGDWVGAGEIVGEVATGAHCSQRCLHWGVRLDGEYIDPTLLIEDLRPSILLPWRS